MGKLLTFLVFLLFINYLAAQETKNNAFKKNQIGALLAHTHMRQGDVNSKNNRLSLPSFTIFYNYHFNENWSLGLHTDFLAEQFIVQYDDAEETIERKRPVAPAIMLGYKPGEHFTFLFGGGVDTDKEETIGLLRIDLEYGLEIRNGLEFVGTLGYDKRIDAYGSLQIGVGLAKAF